MSDSQNLKWYYTTGHKYKMIEKLGEIRPPRSFVAAEGKAAIWFSTEPEWEKTACELIESPNGAGIRRTKEEAAELGGGLVRIGVPPEALPLDWKSFKRLSDISRDAANEMYSSGIACGARPGRWFATFEPIPRAMWVVVECWRDGVWSPIDESFLREMSEPPRPLETTELFGTDAVLTIPIHALFDKSGHAPNLNADPRQVLHESSVIFGIDVMTRNEFLVFGRTTLERMAATATSEPVRVLRIEIDQATEELEQLLALMRTVKGRHDYEASTDQ